MLPDCCSAAQLNHSLQAAKIWGLKGSHLASLGLWPSRISTQELIHPFMSGIKSLRGELTSFPEDLEGVYRVQR